MTQEEIHSLVINQRKYFLSNNTKNNDFRIETLKKIKERIKENINPLFDAFKKDFNKCEFDVISTEISMVLAEIDYFIKNLKKLAKNTKVRTNLINFPAKSYVIKEPYGVTLIISPWNYPFQLSMIPLIGSVAAGNTVILKPSAYSKNVSSIIYEIFKDFDKNHISVVLGSRNENNFLLNERYDYIFFTGSPNVGKIVAQKAAINLTPTTLELGGKSPAIILDDADLEISVKRLVWGKFLNAGQTCVAPDYLLVSKNNKNKVIELIKSYIYKFYFVDGEITNDFPSIINEKHFNRIMGLIDKNKIICGGKNNNLIIEPTVVEADFSDAIMKEEIFGPILPIIEYENIDDVLQILKEKEKPLALYIFTKNKKSANKILNTISSGGASINDTIMHLSNPNLPFGGVGNSGMGQYHESYSFDTFSHSRSVLVKEKHELNIKYPPYNEHKKSFLKKFTNIK
ncbi:MAG: aldehyde dehydrogenase family protein [Candidatus Onthovivens sp.]|nr:aldehyde dehydrogenase family protein [Candidatus Onthovivens sp.]